MVRETNGIFKNIKLKWCGCHEYKISGKQITVGTTTYVLIESTSAHDSSKDKASASAVVKAINESKDADGNQSNIKAFTSMDALTSAIRRQYGSELKSVTSYYDQTSGTIAIKVEAFADLNDAINFSLHVGADSSSDNKISVNISMMSARGLGVNGLNIGGDTVDNGTKAIDIVADAPAESIRSESCSGCCAEPSGAHHRQPGQRSREYSGCRVRNPRYGYGHTDGYLLQQPDSVPGRSGNAGAVQPGKSGCSVPAWLIGSRKLITKEKL